MTGADLDGIMAIADRVHVRHPEAPQVFAERLTLFPAGCRVLADDGRRAGYIVSHPWRLKEPPALDSLLGALPAKPSTYYVHDVALMDEARRSGQGAAGVREVLSDAQRHGFANASLIAVNQTTPFWTRLGFVAVRDATLDAKLTSYGEAVYMTKELSARAAP